MHKDELAPAFSYEIYIETTIDYAWNALTDGDITKQYWYGRRIESDWQVGSAIKFWYDEGHGLDVSGRILRYEPKHLISFTWRVEQDKRVDNENLSRVSLLLEPVQNSVKITVTHDHLLVKSVIADGIRRGWPFVLSRLKTLLEKTPMVSGIEGKKLYFMPEVKSWH